MKKLISEITDRELFTVEGLEGVWQISQRPMRDDGYTIERAETNVFIIKWIPDNKVVTLIAVNCTNDDTAETWQQTRLNMQQLAEDSPWGEDRELPKIDIPVFGQLEIELQNRLKEMAQAAEEQIWGDRPENPNGIIDRIQPSVTTTDSSGVQTIHNLPVGGQITLYKEHYDTLEEILFDIKADLIPLTIEKLQNTIDAQMYIQKGTE